MKKRLRQYPKYPGPVAAVAFNCDGTKAAVGVSYTWDEGEAGMKTQQVSPWVGVRKVGDEVKVCLPNRSLRFLWSSSSLRPPILVFIHNAKIF